MNANPLSMGHSRRWLFARVVLLILANFAIPFWLLAGLAYVYAPQNTIWGWLILAGGLAGGWVSFVNISSQALATSLRHWIGLETLKTLDAFERATRRALIEVKDTLPKLDHLNRQEVTDTWTSILFGESVRVAGPSGTGKSGIVGEVTNLAMTIQMPVLLLNANVIKVSISTLENLDRYVEVTKPLRQCVEDLVKAIGGCLVIIDQLDNTVGYPSFEVLQETLAFVSTIQGACAIVVSTSFDEFCYEPINALGWPLIESKPLDDQQVIELLARLKISDPSTALRVLSQNLLYLSLVAELSSRSDLSKVSGAATLLDKYREALAGSYDSQLIDLAVDVAHQSVEDPTQEIYVNRANRRTITTLVRRNLLIATKAGSVRFRHEQLLYYFYALGAIEHQEPPRQILEKLSGKHTPSALVWVLRLLYQRRAHELGDYLRGALFQPSPLGFYESANLLDEILTWPDISLQNPAATIVVEAFHSNDPLRAYFFKSNPGPEWAPILWELGFFNSPPQPKQTSEGQEWYSWDVQYYLIAVAPQVPDLVIKHVETILGPGWYISQAIVALCRIPAVEAQKALPRIITWLYDQVVADAIAEKVTELMELMISDGRLDSALQVFDALTLPFFPNTEEQVSLRFHRGADKITIFDRLFGNPIQPSPGFEALKKIIPLQVIAVLETHLIGSLKKEAQIEYWPEYEFASWWRNAIEDTQQDLLDTYKDRILRALRDTVEVLQSAEPDSARQLTERYLQDQHSILRRIGLNVLRMYPRHYSDLVRRELLKVENLNDVHIHHEYFVLLRMWFPQLELVDQGKLIMQILNGPDPVKTEALAIRMSQVAGEDKESYIDKHRKSWIRDRLWMVKEHLYDEGKRRLAELIDEGGEPSHPEFLSYTYETDTDEDFHSPSDGELTAKTPSELADYVITWRPDQTQRAEQDFLSYEGSAWKVAEVVLADLDAYRSDLVEIASVRPEYAHAILNRLCDFEHKDPRPISWSSVFGLLEGLLDHNKVWEFEAGGAVRTNWTSVRLMMAQLIQIGILNQQKLMPEDDLERAQTILLRLMDDPDPSEESDRPKEGMAGFNDPIAVALSHVRPVALTTLILCLRRRAQIAKNATDTADVNKVRRLDVRVRHALSRKLDKTIDPSRAVRSVLGEHLRLLFWLDKEWVEANIANIFPAPMNEENSWFYAAAWDAFVSFNQYRSYLLDLIRPYYVTAMSNMSAGYISRSHLNVSGHFAIHVVLEYFLGDYGLPFSLDQLSLMAEWYKRMPSANYADISWALWRVCHEAVDKRDAFWPKSKGVWDFRNQQIGQSHHAPEYDAEMTNFAELLSIVPNSETLKTLQPLIEGVVVHIGRDKYRNKGWDAVEKYLARHVDTEPVRAIQLYLEMYKSKVSPLPYPYHSAESRKIVEVAAQNALCRSQVTDLLNLLASRTDFTFQYIWDRISV